jgi:hypothetical protein
MSTFKFGRLCASLALALPLGAIGALAQGPGAGGPPAQGPGAGGPLPPGFGAPPPPTQGFESNVQIPANYTPQEAAAVAVVEAWVRNTAAHNLDGAMSVLDNNMIVRPDPARQPAYGPVAQCSSYPSAPTLTRWCSPSRSVVRGLGRQASSASRRASSPSGWTWWSRRRVPPRRRTRVRRRARR